MAGYFGNNFVAPQCHNTDIAGDANIKGHMHIEGNITSGCCVTANTFKGNGSELTGIEGVPSGIISMWSGAISAIPLGYVLCDGTNGTPDLRNRFIMGAGDAYSPAASGGSSSVTLSTANLPSHTHGDGSYGGTTSGGGSHNHTGTTSTKGNHSHSGSTNTTGNHSHSTKYVQNGIEGSPAIKYANGSGFGNMGTTSSGNHSHSISTNTTGNHNHTFTTSTKSNHTHAFNVGGTSGATGSGEAVDTTPPYFALAYIMKT